MSFSINYISSLTSANNNIVIFVSNLSQLRSIELPSKIQLNIDNKQFVNKFTSDKCINLFNYEIKSNLLANIKIIQITSKNKDAIKIGAGLHNELSKLKQKDCTFILSTKLQESCKKVFSDIILGFGIKSYNFLKYKSKKSNNKYITKLNIYNFRKSKLIDYNLNLLFAINHAKDLISEPANILTPLSFADRCKNLNIKGLKVRTLNANQLKLIGMRSLLGVAQGSYNEPYVVILEWNIKKNIKPTVLVGKGVTFDTGGISIKPSSGMEDMITDMGGSAVVVGSMINASLNNSSRSIVGIIGLVENMPDGNAQRPGDIVKSLSGQTIEILNTDAEGRLVLGDLITYVQNKYNAKEIIDFATLTGAIMIALGTHRAGLFSNDDKLSKKLENAGFQSDENIWRMPMGDEYDQEIESIRADIKNIGSSKYGGSIHAAQFIKRFIKNNTPWAHIDIAGVSWSIKGGQNSFSTLHSPGATAFGVRLIDQFLKGK